MKYAKCPNCGTLHPVPADAPTKTPCRTCAIDGALSRLAWEAPRRNNYDRTRR